MDPATRNALIVAVPIMLLGFISGYMQITGLRDLNARAHVPSDELNFLRRRHRRRLFAGVLMLLIGGLITYTFVSGMEARASAIADAKSEKPPLADGEQKVIPEEDKAFVRFWGAYWIAVISLVFVLLSVAVWDGWASRRYWMVVYRRLREEHNTQLRRDLAVYKQHKDQQRNSGRNGYGGRLGDGKDE